MSQPIALPSSSNNQDSSMESGSYTGTNGSFNPASYTRHFMGSPISWKAGSFGHRFHPGTSPNQLAAGQLDLNDFKMAKLSSSIESDRGSILNGLTRDGELCRDYTCCGLELTDLHALIEHFEEAHVIVIDPTSQTPIQPSMLPYPNPHPNVPEQATPTPQQPPYFPVPNQHLQQLESRPPNNTSYTSDHITGPFDPDDMELDLDTSHSTSTPSSGGPSPPDTPISTPQSSYPSPNTYGHQNLPNTSFSAPGSTCPSPHTANLVSAHLDQAPVSAFETTTILRVPSVMRRRHSPLSAFPSTLTRAGTVVISPEAFNMYSGYSNYSSSMPGTVPNSPLAPHEEPVSLDGRAADATHTSPILNGSAGGGNQYGNCVPPALLYAQGASSLSNSAPASRAPSPSSLPPLNTSGASSSQSATTSPQSTTAPRPSTTLSRPATSLLLSKPFKCPKPNCNKSYKQANGLKYHITHGSCNFAPPKDLEQVQALLASKRAAAAAARQGSHSPPSTPHSPNGSPADIDIALGLGMLTESELREVEREAEKRLRPFACGIGDCQRRYKNMNGLKYHYQHSGDHGAIGLAQLANGTHECLVNSASHRSASAANSRVGSRVVSRQPSRERGLRGSTSTPATPIHARSPILTSPQAHHPSQQSAPPTAFPQSMQAQYGGQFNPQQQAQMAYQQQFAQHQRLQYQQLQGQKGPHQQTHTKAASVSFAGMPIPTQQQYLGMALGGENGLPG